MFSELADRQWLWFAAGFYLAGFLAGSVALFRGGRPSNALIYSLICAGYFLQWAGLGVRGKAVGECPLGNTFELFQFVSWSAITLYLVVGVKFRSSILGFFTACLATTFTVVSLSIPSWDENVRRHIFGGNPWIEFHAALALFSYGVFALLALTSSMFLFRNYSLKSKHLGGWFSFLPSIMDLEHIGVRLLSTGVVLLAAALAVGWVYWSRDIASVGIFKAVATIAVWVLYASALVLRLSGRLLARSFAWVCIALFAVALGSLAVVDSSRHPAATLAEETRP
jgi:HemX protein